MLSFVLPAWTAFVATPAAIRAPVVPLTAALVIVDGGVLSNAQAWLPTMIVGLVAQQYAFKARRRPASTATSIARPLSALLLAGEWRLRLQKSRAFWAVRHRQGEARRFWVAPGGPAHAASTRGGAALGTTQPHRQDRAPASVPERPEREPARNRRGRMRGLCGERRLLGTLCAAAPTLVSTFLLIRRT